MASLPSSFHPLHYYLSQDLSEEGTEEVEEAATAGDVVGAVAGFRHCVIQVSLTIQVFPGACQTTKRQLGGT